MLAFTSRFFFIFMLVIGGGCLSKNKSADRDSDGLQGPIASHPHADRFSRGGTPDSPTTLFKKVPASSIGIEFVHRWKPKDQYEARLLKTGFTGGGVCLGDYDGDGWCDVYLTRPHGGGRLYRNQGHFQFRDVTEIAGVSTTSFWTTGATFVDVNNDARLDLFVSCHLSPNRLFVNQGDGKFKDMTPTSGLGFSGASVKTIFADYDNDGDLDAFLVTNRMEPKKAHKIRYLGSPGNYSVAPEHQELVAVINLPSGEQKFTKAGQFNHLFRNNLIETGKLNFEDVSQAAGLNGNFHGLDATWWDYDHDGDPDLYVANDFTDPDQFLRNNGDGTFTDVTQQAVPNTPWFAMGAAFGDVNNDGRLDLIATDMAGTTHYREKMAMGSMDSVAWFLDTAEPRQYMRNALFVNTGTERFLEVAHMAGVASSDWTWSVKIADLDNDGWEDIFVTNGFTRDYLNSDFNLELRKRGAESDSMAWYEAPELKERNIGFRNLGNLKFANESKNWGLDELSIAFGAALGDLDNDGDLDLITINFDQPPSIYRNQSSTNNSITLMLQGNSSNAGGLGATIKLTTPTRKMIRYHNPMNGFMSSNDRAVHFGLGNDQQIEELTIQWPSGQTQKLTSLEPNHRFTISEPATGLPLSVTRSPPFYERHVETQLRHRERAFDDFARQPLLPNKMSQYGPGIAVGDVDHDGNQDVYLGGAAGQSGQLAFGKSSGGFKNIVTAPFEGHRESEDMGCLFFDIDSDGDLDLFVVSGGVECDAESEHLRDRLYINRLHEYGEMKFEYDPRRLPNARNSGSVAAAADFDKDGDLDVFVGGRVVPHAYPMAPTSQLLRNEKARLLDVTDEIAKELTNPGMVTSALWSDVDNDGWLDLLITLEYGGIQVYKNEQGRLVDRSQAAGTHQLLGWWNSIVGFDADLDGDMDYAVGNLGLNTKYHPSPETPQLLFYGDFDKSGKNRIVEAKSSSSELLPVRGRSCSSNAMPFLKSKFETYHSFAISSLTDIYSEACLAESLKVAVNTAASGILINDGTGRFRFREFPRLAQAAPTFGMQVVFANDDSLPDLVLAQNFNGPQRETGRMNGGIGTLMIGHGACSFEVMPASQSGIVIPEDAMGLIQYDENQDGKNDLVASINNGPLLVLHGTRDSRRLRVQLNGHQPSLIGSRIQVTLADGSTLATEVALGAGYLSQGEFNRYEFGFKLNNPIIDCSIRYADGTTDKANASQLKQWNVVFEKK